MQGRNWSERFWEEQSTFLLLGFCAALMLFAWLGARELWTQEHRWANIVSGMFSHQDFFHPFLKDKQYYDKPLLSYWFIAAFSFITGHLSPWELRLPSALAGFLSIWSIYRLGSCLKNKKMGLLAGWMLLTTFYFIFWARTSSADMLNMAGSLFAVSWYAEKKIAPSFYNYAVFFLILALTSLCKGLVGILVPLLVIFPDLMMGQKWRKLIRPSLFLAVIPALFIYVLPFWASATFGAENYGQNGLYLVYKENILRYFQPFDHKDPIYAYFIFLPLYLLPWTIFFFPTLFSLKRRWVFLTQNEKWMVWAVLLLFVFFTLSGSRRNYYILPIVPFALLMTADWFLEDVRNSSRRMIMAGKTAISFFLLFLLSVVFAWSFYYTQNEPATFAKEVRKKVNQASFSWYLMDTGDELRYYLRLPAGVKNELFNNSDLTKANVLNAWPILRNPDLKTIYLTRKTYQNLLRPLLPYHEMLESELSYMDRFTGKNKAEGFVAFIPKTMKKE